MKTADIAALLVAGMQQQGNGNTDIGWHTGVVQAWDEQTGLNSILINGNTFNNLSVLSTSNSIMITAGDTVALMRVQSQYFVLGRVQAPGAGAALQIRSASDSTTVLTVNNTSYADVPGSPGPTISNVYIGSARRCLVFLSAQIAVNNSYASVSFTVTGASNIAAADTRRGLFGINHNGGSSTSTAYGAANAVVLLTAADGLSQGFNTFAMKVRTSLFGTGTGFDITNRSMTVFPF